MVSDLLIHRKVLLGFLHTHTQTSELTLGGTEIIPHNRLST